MRIKLVKKNIQNDVDQNLVVMYEVGEEENRKKVIQKFTLGQEVDLPNEHAFEICAKYKGCFEVIGGQQIEASEAVKPSKSMRDYPNKAVL
jgi:hypothetical protein